MVWSVRRTLTRHDYHYYYGRTSRRDNITYRGCYGGHLYIRSPDSCVIDATATTMETIVFQPTTTFSFRVPGVPGCSPDCLSSIRFVHPRSRGRSHRWKNSTRQLAWERTFRRSNEATRISRLLSSTRHDEAGETHPLRDKQNFYSSGGEDSINQLISLVLE